ncbi:MAG TPA: SusC/RagA family TonB-linked outer membrane protein, partial [Anseongella sp.]|nr:SusC/RagA family TonB-linked outer membrane protein [Anseongella sp.]
MRRIHCLRRLCSMLVMLLILFQQYANAQSVMAARGLKLDPPATDTSPMREKTVELKRFLESVSKKNGWKFVYDPGALKIRISQQDALKAGSTIAEINGQLHKYSLGLKEIGKDQFAVVAYTAEPSAPADNKEAAQAPEVRGTITDTAGIPLPGVSVTVKDAQGMGTSSDLNGKYILEVPDNAVLVFSFMGFVSQEIPVEGREVIDIVLKAEDSKLDEVVVVGFGTQRKVTTIGAQSTISPSELKQPVRNLTTVLAGRISGVIAVQRSGEPGYDNANLWVRGVSTFTGTSPLVLVDGVERSFANIDPEDIESFSILKDASATAVYGVRGANGVILITTKRGQPGKPQINAGFNQGVTSFTRLPRFVDGVTYMEMANEAHTTRGKTAPYSQETIERTMSGEDPYLYPNVDWLDEIFNDFGSNTRVNLNINGGSENASYYISTSYYNEKGLFNRDELNNYNS